MNRDFIMNLFIISPDGSSKCRLMTQLFRRRGNNSCTSWQIATKEGLKLHRCTTSLLKCTTPSTLSVPERLIFQVIYIDLDFFSGQNRFEGDIKCPSLRLNSQKEKVEILCVHMGNSRAGHRRKCVCALFPTVTKTFTLNMS